MASRFSFRPVIRIALLLVCAATALSLLSGCVKPEPKTVVVLEPVVLRELSLDGRLITTSKYRSISPDGKYLLAAILGKTTDSMVAIPIRGDDDTLSLDPVSLYEADTAWTKHNLVQWYPLGWISDSKCVFAIHGWQNQGPHKGRRGTAIYTADIETGSASLISYVDVPEQGEIIEEAALTDGGKVYMLIAGRFLEFDLEAKTYRLVRDDLPSYYGVSVVAMSPKGDQVVYSVYGEDKSGVYLIDVATGTERPLAETGESLSFFPSWSPDGEYIAMYTLHRVNESSPSDFAQYNFIPGEDGPIPSAEEITVMDPEGNVVRSIRVEDQYLSHAYWLKGQGSLVFLSGPVTFGKWGEVISAEYEAVWIADATGDSPPVKVADLKHIEAEMGERTSYAYPVASLPDGAGALLNIAGAKGASVWMVSPDSTPSKIADGYWQTPRLTPAYLDSVVGIVSGESESHLYVVGPKGATLFGKSGSPDMTIAAYTTELLITSSHYFTENRTEATVYRMVCEKTYE